MATSQKLINPASSKNDVYAIYHKIALISASIATGIAVMVLCGWVFGIPALTSFNSHWVTMKVNSACCLALGGSAVIAYLLGARDGTRKHWFVTLVGGAVAVYALSAASQYLLHADFHIDQLLLQQPMGLRDRIAPGRPSPGTLTILLMMAISLLALGKSRTQAIIVQCLSLFITFYAVVVVIGYAFDVESLYGGGNFTATALPTALSLISISVALFLAEPELGAAATYCSPTLSGQLLRRCSLASLITPIAVGELRRQAQLYGLVDTWLGLAIMVTSAIVMCEAGVLWLTGKFQTIESKLRQQQQKFQVIFDETLEFIGLLSTDGTVIDCNRTALEFFAAQPADVVGKPFWDTPWWTHSEHLQRQVKDAIQRAADGELVRFESEHPSISGRIFHFDVSIKPVFDNEGKVILLIPEGRDITEKKEAEQRVTEFYSTVSHELRTPLTSIRGSLGLIEGGKTGKIPDKTMTMVKIARDASDRLIRLINDILDLRKIEAGMIELKKKDADAAKLIQRTIDSLEGMAHAADIKLVPEIETQAAIHCDEDRLIQVLTNLVSNAIKFSPVGSTVIIKLEARKDYLLRFSVKDNGPGIEPEQAHKVFARFQQIDQSDTRKQGGTGLGLAITKAIVEEHGGKIGFDSEVGKGTTFWFEITACLSPSANGKATEPSPAGPVDMSVRPALLVEDDDGIAEVVTALLENDNFKVARARSLSEAHALLNQYKPLVILLDLGLPDGDGLDLLSELNRDEERKHIPVVVVTSRDEDGVVRYGHPALIDWVRKPIDENKLHLAFEAARRRNGPARVLLVEDDAEAREILKQQLDSLGVTCLEAQDGAEAITKFRDANPDLVILDLQIPAPDGFGVVEILKKEPHGHKPLIIYTAQDLSSDQRQLLKLGLTAHMTKSVDSIDQVMGTVREFLNGLLPAEQDK